MAQPNDAAPAMAGGPQLYDQDSIKMTSVDI